MTCNMTTKQTDTKTPVNLKEQNASHIFRVTIRDREHFYKIVKWLNENVGKGEDKWTMEGRVLKTLKVGKTVTPKIYVYPADFDTAGAVYLSLL